jgi:photosystem II stability/assembly factor-like uncharacterized protein
VIFPNFPDCGYEPDNSSVVINLLVFGFWTLVFLLVDYLPVQQGLTAMKAIFSALVCATCLCVQAQTGIWTQLPNSPGPNSIRHDDIYFTDPTNGWASQNNYIYRTTNGGLNWTTNFYLPGTHFRSVAFATPQVGFAGNLGVGSYDGNVSNTNVMYRSIDGGVTWSNVDGFAEAGMKGLCSMFVLDSQHIFGAGRVRGPAYFIKSTDGGNTWTTRSLTAAGVMNGIMDIYFTDTNNGWVVGMDTNSYSLPPYYGRIAKTTDGGNTWTTVLTTPVANSYFWKMSWPSTNVGYVSLQQNGSYSSIIFYKTTNGGVTWISNGIPEVSVGLYTNGYNFYLQGLGFVSTNEGWVGGASGLPNFASSFLHTTNGGASWSPVGFSDTFFINRFRFLSPGLGFASGGNLYLYSVPVGITNQPANAVVVGPTNVTFTVSAVGTAPLSYQWTYNGTNIPNNNSPILALTNVLRQDDGTYAVYVSNNYGAIQSSNTVLRVILSERFGPPQLLPGNQIQLLFNDADGGAILTSNDLAGFQVYASTNLMNWIPLTNSLTLTNGSVILLDAITNQSQRFYKVLSE